MYTLVLNVFLARSPGGTAGSLAASEVTANDGTVRAITLALVVIILAIALRTVGRALEPVMELVRTLVSAGIAVLLMLTALVLVVVIAIGIV